MDTSAHDFEIPDEALIDAEIIEPANDSSEPTGIPDMPEDEASWIQERPPLSDAIVDNAYDTTSLVLATQYGPGKDHLVPTSYQDGKDDWYKIKAFEGELVSIATRYPIRVGRLRELYFALSAADARLKTVNRLIDEERRAINRRNNEINQSVSRDLEKLRIDYVEKRALLARAINETEDERIRHKQSRQNELDMARADYWEVRTQACAMRDARLEYVRETRNKLNEADKAHADTLRAINKSMLEDDIARLTARLVKLTDELDVKLGDISQAKYQISVDCLGTRNNAQELYDSTYESLIQALHGQRIKLEAARDSVYAAYEPELKVIRENIHRCNEEAIKVTDDHQRELANAKGALERLEAKSERGAIGHAPGLTQSALLARASHTIHVLPPDSGPTWQIWLQKLYEVALLLVTGGLFGISLGLAFGFVKTVDITKGKNPVVAIVFATIGVSIFATIEKFITHLWTFVAERNGTMSKADTVSAKVISALLTVLTVVIAMALTLGIIALETYVELQGIGQFMAARKAIKGIQQVDKLTMTIVASIVSVPFILYHSISAYRSATFQQAEVLRKASEGDLLAESNILVVYDEAGQAAERVRALEHQPATEKLTAEYWTEQAVKLTSERDNSQACVELQTFIDDFQNKIDSDARLQYLKSVIERSPEDLQIENAALSGKESDIDRIRTEIYNTESELTDKRDNLLKMLPPSADLGERGIVPYVNDVVIAENQIDGDIPKLPTDATAAEVVAYQKWNSLRRAIGQDPTVVYYNRRIKSLQSAIHSLDIRVGKERKSLKDRQRSIEVRIFQSEANQKQDTQLWALYTQAQSDLINAQAHYNEEQECLRRLVEAPRLLQWLEHIRQYYFYKNSTQRQLDARKRINEIPPSEPKKLPANEVKQLPSKD
jgi:hypothetical protein